MVALFLEVSVIGSDGGDGSLVVDLGHIAAFWTINTIIDAEDTVDIGLLKTITLAERSVVRGFPVHHVEASLEYQYGSRLDSLKRQIESGGEGGGGFSI